MWGNEYGDPINDCCKGVERTKAFSNECCFCVTLLTLYILLRSEKYEWTKAKVRGGGGDPGMHSKVCQLLYMYVPDCIVKDLHYS